MKRLGLAFDRLLIGLAVCAGLSISAIAVLITLDVILRNLGISSFSWLLELTEYALFVTTFIAAPWVLSVGSHVRVDLLVSSVSSANARLLELVADVLGGAVAVTLGWHGARVSADSFLRGDVIYKELVVPEWWLLVFIPIGCMLLTVVFARRFVRTLRHVGPNADGPVMEGF